MQPLERVVFSHTMGSLLERCATGLTDEKWAHLASMGVSRTHRLPAMGTVKANAVKAAVSY